MPDTLELPDFFQRTGDPTGHVEFLGEAGRGLDGVISHCIYKHRLEEIKRERGDDLRGNLIAVKQAHAKPKVDFLIPNDSIEAEIRARKRILDTLRGVQKTDTYPFVYCMLEMYDYCISEQQYWYSMESLEQSLTLNTLYHAEVQKK
jgi:hypothetical protein